MKALRILVVPTLLMLTALYAAKEFRDYPNVSLQDLYLASSTALKNLEQQVDADLRGDPSIELQVLQAKIAYLHHDYNGAYARLAPLCADSSNVAAHYLMARVEAHRGNAEAASNWFYRALTPPRPIPDVRNDLAALLENDVDAAYPHYWRLNDPTPVSLENEFVINMIQRLDTAFEEFSSNGELDDRGAIYIKYGKPEQREVFEHHRHATECWIYTTLQDEPVFFDFIKSVRYPSFTRVTSEFMIEGDIWSPVPGAVQTRLATETMGGGSDTFQSMRDQASGVYGSPATSGDMSAGPPSRFFFDDRKNLHPFYRDIALQLTENQVSRQTNTAMDGPVAERSMDVATQALRQTLQNYSVKLDTQRRQLPETIVKMDSKQIPPITRYARFRHGNDIRVELYYALPYKAFDMRDELILTQQFALKNKKGVVEGSGATELLIPANSDPTSHIIDQQNILFAPNDPGIFAFEIHDPDRSYLSTATLEFDLQSFLQDTLFMSDIQLSTHIRNGDDSKFTKGGLFIQPYPFSFIRSGVDPFFYFEVYNLKREEQQSRYEVTCSVFEKNDPNLLQRLRGQVETSHVSFSNRYESNRPSDIVSFQLDTENMSPGTKVVQIKVRDLLSGQVTHRKLQLRIDPQVTIHDERNP